MASLALYQEAILASLLHSLLVISAFIFLYVIMLVSLEIFKSTSERAFSQERGANWSSQRKPLTASLKMGITCVRGEN